MNYAVCICLSLGKVSVDVEKDAYYPGYLSSLKNPKFAMIKPEYDTVMQWTTALAVRTLHR